MDNLQNGELRHVCKQVQDEQEGLHGDTLGNKLMEKN